MLQFNGKPYPRAAVLPDFEAHSARLAELVELDDEQCEALLGAFNLLLKSAKENAYRRHGVCSAVESIIDGRSGFDVYEVLCALGLAWPHAKTSHGILVPYFCDGEGCTEHWVGVNYERRVQFMQFCVDELTEFMQDRSRSTCTSM